MRSWIFAAGPAAFLCLATAAGAEERTTRTVDGFAAGLVGYQDERGSSSVLHEEVLGGERDVLDEEGRLTIGWDGDDGDPFSLDGTGLGGLDLTEAGLFDRLVVERAAGAPETSVRLVVWTDEENASAATVRGGERVELLLAELEPLLGDGADLCDVGALELVLEDRAPTAE
jgi:hypothetical protein